MHLKKLGLTLIAGLAFIALPTQATWLYGTQGGNPNLIRIDSVTGAIENVGLLPAGSNSTQDAIQGLTGRADGTLLYTDGTDLDGVHVLNPTNAGLITTLPLPLTGRGGLSFDTPTNLLFTVTNLGVVGAQVGLGGPVAPLPFPLNPVFPGALGGDDQGRHFVSAFDPTGLAAIFEIDPVTGFPINALPEFFPFDMSGLAFDGTNLYATNLIEPFIYTLNPETGAVISAAMYDGAPITSLAFLPGSDNGDGEVPAPATLALLALGLIGIRQFKRKAIA